jgi:hypothetical protein
MLGNVAFRDVGHIPAGEPGGSQDGNDHLTQRRADPMPFGHRKYGMTGSGTASSISST